MSADVILKMTVYRIESTEDCVTRYQFGKVLFLVLLLSSTAKRCNVYLLAMELSTKAKTNTFQNHCKVSP